MNKHSDAPPPNPPRGGEIENIPGSGLSPPPHSGGGPGWGPQEVAENAARSMYAQDRASQALGIRLVDIRPGYACLKMTIREDMVNGHRVCHGGLIFTLADS